MHDRPERHVKVLAEHYVRSGEAEKSAIWERDSLKVIDKVKVTLSE